MVSFRRFNLSECISLDCTLSVTLSDGVLVCSSTESNTGSGASAEAIYIFVTCPKKVLSQLPTWP